MMRILLAHDGSDGAAKAVALARSIAWPKGSVVRVVSVIEPVVMPLPGPWAGGTAPPRLDEEIAAIVGEANAGAVRELRAARRSVEGAVLRGRPATVIIDEARTFGADLVVMGSRGHGGIVSLLLGSVSIEVTDHAPCPVLVARAGTLSRVVFATDESPSALTAESLLAGWPIFDGVPIRVVSVAHLEQPWTTGIAPTMYRRVLEAHAADLRDARQTHQRLAAEAAGRLRESDRLVESELREGDPATEIIAVAEEQGADLIVVGSRGHTGLTRVFLGSVARNVLHGSSASVLIVRERTIEPAA